MTSCALSVENLSKQFRIYERPADRLTETLTGGLLRKHRPFWALRDISFAVEPGTTTGIIGPNGCGKSTLLQIIAGTLEATEGRVNTCGRINALLELGAGFNPEFTGIENIRMNSALMGLSAREMRTLLPEIERFAEIGDFIRQPVKTYSSGMYIRLAFAIAVSHAPDILIVDEALAVGDAVFQHRCLRRIKEMQQAGATVLFVSHDPAAVRALCSRAILLNAGQVVADGAPSDVLNRYQRLIMQREAEYDETAASDDSINDSTGTDARDDVGVDEFDTDVDAPLRFNYRHGDGSAEIVRAELLDDDLRPTDVVASGAPLVLRARVRFNCDVAAPVFGFIVRNRHGLQIYGTNTEQQQLDFERVSASEAIEVTFRFHCWLGINDYSISLAVHSSALLDGGVSYDWIDDVLFFRVTSTHLIEGLVNLDAEAIARRVPTRPSRSARTHAALAPTNS